MKIATTAEIEKIILIANKHWTGLFFRKEERKKGNCYLMGKRDGIPFTVRRVSAGILKKFDLERRDYKNTTFADFIFKTDPRIAIKTKR